MSERALPLLALLSLGVVAWQQSQIGNFPPPPSNFMGVALVFSLLALLALLSPQLAAALGVAVVIWIVFAYHGALAPTTARGGAGAS